MTPPQKPLDYLPPEKPPHNPNTGGKIFLRILAGTFVGGASAACGSYVYNTSHNVLLGFLPVAVCLAAAAYVSLRWRRHGYFAGIILAPFILGAIAVILLLILCGGLVLVHH